MLTEKKISNYYKGLIKKKLHPIFWDESQNFDSDIAQQLVLIAEKFFGSLHIDTDIKDIVLVGSLANYNWHSLSDLDIHIILNYNDISSDTELVDNYLELERKLWNNVHSIEILGFPIEISFNDIEDNINSSGIYSILNEEWVRKPERTLIQYDSIIESEEIYTIISKAVDKVLFLYNDNTITALQAYQRSKRIWKMIKKLRGDFLEDEGEFGSKNLAFKRLRNDNYIEKLVNLKTKTHDEIFSIYST